MNRTRAGLGQPSGLGLITAMVGHMAAMPMPLLRRLWPAGLFLGRAGLLWLPPLSRRPGDPRGALVLSAADLSSVRAGLSGLVANRCSAPRPKARRSIQFRPRHASVLGGG